MNDPAPSPAAAAQRQLHPAFRVVIQVAHAFKFTPVQKGTESTPHEPVVEHADGRTFKRVLAAASDLVEGAETVPVVINFGPGAIDREIADTEAARAKGAPTPKRSFNQVVAQHIEQLAMRDHAPRESWISLTSTDKAVEAFLNSYFELGAAKP